MKEKPFDLIKNSHLVAPTYNWMLNGYAKHTELTKEDLKAYFKAREQKRKDKLNATR